MILEKVSSKMKEMPPYSQGSVSKEAVSFKASGKSVHEHGSVFTRQVVPAAHRGSLKPKIEIISLIIRKESIFHSNERIRWERLNGGEREGRKERHDGQRRLGSG